MKVPTAIVLSCLAVTAGCGALGAGDSIPVESRLEASKRTKPDIEVGDGPPPRTLVVRDVIAGSGKVARKGDDVTIEYLGVRHGSDEEYANSWKVDYPSVFEIGPTEMIAGWELGLQGMKVGGRRRLAVPVQLLEFGGPPKAEDRPPGGYDYEEAVVFVIDLLGVS